MATIVSDKGYRRFLSELAEEYTRRFPKSAALHQDALRHLIDGGSHAARLNKPFPIRIVSARGSRVQDVDGHDILDFWQGHYANILGHNPAVVTQALANAFASVCGLQTGHPDALEVELAELLKRRTGAERVRFTTSGTLATMYAILLAKAFTRRDLVLKVGGGWHGGHPWGLKGIHYGAQGFHEPESLGLSPDITEATLVTRFNDPEDLEEKFRTYGDRIACFIVEPWMGGVFIPAKPQYLALARSLTQRYGAVLILDEVQTGFRFRAGDVGTMYGVRPDLAVFAKIVGGGMPLAAVAGSEAIMQLCSTDRELRARFDGGTFSAHPAAMLAAKVMVQYLVNNEAVIYPRLGEVGDRLRRGAERIFAGHGLLARCTGYGNEAVPASSASAIHFPLRDDVELDSPERVSDPQICDVTLHERVLKLALLLHDVYIVHGLGAASTSHTDTDIDRFLTALDAVAQRIKENLYESSREHP